MTAAVAPLTLPLAVGLLFGNYDVLFPVLYGAMLLAAIAPTRASAVVGGAALVVASLKIHPASMGLWFLVRALRERRRDGYLGGSAHVLAAAIGIGLVVIALSVLLGGPGLWADYAQVICAGTRAVIVDPRNAGIAALIAGSLGGDDGLARMLHLVVGAAALAATAWAAWRRSDPVESFAWATAASLATLPVTWYHYPGAMLPIAVAAMLRASGPDVRGVSLLVTAGGRRRRAGAGLASVAVARGRAHRGCGAGVRTGADTGAGRRAGSRNRMMASRITHDSIQTTGKASHTAIGMVHGRFGQGARHDDERGRGDARIEQLSAAGAGPKEGEPVEPRRSATARTRSRRSRGSCRARSPGVAIRGAPGTTEGRLPVSPWSGC